MATSKMYLNSAAAAILALAGFAGSAWATQTINVKFGNSSVSADAMNGKSFITNNYQQAPAPYTGTTWNDYFRIDDRGPTAITVTGLLDSDGTATGVGYTTNTSPQNVNYFFGPRVMGNQSNVTLLNSGLYRVYNSGGGNTMNSRLVVTGLNLAKTYNIYLACGSELNLNTRWGIGTATVAPTTTKDILNTAMTKVAQTWKPGDNWLVFYNVAPQADGKIYVWGYNLVNSTANSGITLNGFQIVDATGWQNFENDMLSCSFGTLGTGWISGTNVNLYVPTGTPVSSLTPTFTLSPGATITPTGPQNFGNPVAYTVTAANGTPKVYTIAAIVGTMPISISNTLTPADAGNPANGVDIDTTVGTGKTGLLIGTTQTYWGSGGFLVPLILNGNSLIIDSSGGNTMNVGGPISGGGMLTFQNGGSTPMHVSGSTGNTYTGPTIISSAQVSLEKSSGDALRGSITMTNAAAKMTWTASDQINDGANIYLNVSGASLDLEGFTDTINELHLITGTTVKTATGGILRVAKLFVNEVRQPDVARMEGDGYVLGAGSIEVGASGPATWVPSTPATPAPTNGRNFGSTLLATLTKLDWSDCPRADSYDVYLWDASGSKPGTATATGLTSSEYTTLPALLTSTTYKWQIVAKNTLGDTPGPVWIFTTFGLNMIGLKYSRAYTFLATDVVGAPGYEQANWTMAPGVGYGPPDLVNPPLTSLKDNDGVATSVNVTSWTFTAINGWSDAATTLDQKLLADYCANGPSISFAGLSNYAPSGYAVVVYYEMNGRPQRYILTAGSTTITRNVSMTAPASGDPFWLEGTDSSPGTASNYTVLGSSAAPLTSDTFTIAMDPTGGNGWVGGTAAVQIVQLPPVTAGPNPNLISVDFIYSATGSVPCTGDTSITGTLKQNAAGQIFTGQVGSWNALNLGVNNSSTNSASLTNLVNGAGTATTVAFKMGHATTVGASGGDWRNSPVLTFVTGSLRQEQAFLYYPTLTGNHINWDLTGLTPNAHYRLTMFGNCDSTFTNIANSGAGVLDSEGDWNWADVAANSSGVIAGNLLYTQSSNNTRGVFGLQVESVTQALPTIAVEQPTGTGLANGTSTVNFGSALTGMAVPLTFTIRNTGTAPLSGIEVTKDGTNSADFMLTTAPATTVAAGESTSFVVTFTPLATGTRTAMLHIASNDSTSNPFNISLTGTGAAPQADLTIMASDGSPTYVPGTITTYTITVGNAGPSAVTAAPVSDVFPPDATDVNWSAVVAGGAMVSTPSGTGNITGTVNLPVGGTVTYTAIAQISSSATTNLVNTATVGVPGGVTDPNPANNASTDTDTAARRADLAIAKMVDNPTPRVGANVVFTLTATNNGPSAATGVSVADILPSGYQFVSANPSAAYNAMTGVWTIGALGNGASATLGITAKVNATGTYQNTASINGTEQDPVLGNNTDSKATNPVSLPAIAVEQPAGTTLTSGTGTVDFGSSPTGTAVPLTFTIRNTGTAPLTSIAVTMDGTNSADYAVTSAPAATVAVDDSTTFVVTFTPSAIGTRTAVLHIASNDTTLNPFNINLTGTGAVPPPTVTSGNASGITESAATLSGTVNANGFITTARIEYGLTASYGSTASVTLSPNDGATAQNVSASVSGLQAATTYHYRLTAANGGGTSPGVDLTFATYPAVPYTYTISNNSVTITGYTGSGGAVSIPGTIIGLPVTVIGSDAFANNTTLASVTIPAGVTSIGDWAFLSCTNLTSVTIPAGVTSIGVGAFLNCTKLGCVTIPASIACIGDYAFLNCTALHSAIFLGDAPSMGGGVFFFAAGGFKVYYTSGASGFNPPIWDGYPSVNTGNTSSLVIWLMDNGFPSDANPQDDPNSDGVSLLMAYALNLDPKQNLSGSMSKPALAGSQMSLTFYAGRSDVTYTVETSTDLQTWSTTGVTLSAPDANGLRTASVPLSGPSRYMRLAVSVP